MAIDVRKLRQLSLLGRLGDEEEDPLIAPEHRAPVLRASPGNLQNVTQEPEIVDAPPNFKLERVQETGIPEEPRSNILRLYEDINKMYTPRTKSTDRLDTLLDTFPERNKPNWARKLVAGGLGYGAARRGRDPIEPMEKTLYAPYMRDVEEWKTKATPYTQAAQIENTANINERNLVNNILQAQTWQDKNEIALIRANAYAAKNNGASIEIDKNTGQVVATYTSGPKAGTVEYLGKVPGSSTAAELADIRGDWNLQTARARGAAQANVATIREGTYVTDGAGNTYRIEGTTKTEIPRQPGETGTPTVIGTGSQQGQQGRRNPGQFLVAQQEARNNVWEDYPQYRKFFTEPDANGNVQLKTGNNAWDTSYAPWETEGDRQAKKEYDETVRLITQYSGGSTSVQQQPQQRQPQNDLRQRAITFLQQNKLPVTEKNIEHAIRTGRVK
jgi:hypothetical protein